MSTLILIAMFVLIGYLWEQLQALRQRVELLEMTSGTAAEPEAMIEPARVALDPDPVARRTADFTTIHVAAELGSTSPWGFVEEPEQTFAAEQEPEPARSWTFEDIFGRRLPIWAGGVTLAVAGFLIVKYSIDAGLLSPITRVIMGLIFGTALIGQQQLDPDRKSDFG